MPRPGTRSRPAPRKAATKSNDTHNDEPETRGRTRSTRTMETPSNNAVKHSTRASSRKGGAALDRLTAATDDSSDSLEVGRRVEETPAQSRRDTTGLDLGDDMFSGLEDSFEDSGLANGALSLDTSSLTLSSFKPRSRQSSFIGRNDQPLIRPSSKAGNVSGVSSSFSIGAFRRRAREPSILGTARKPHPDVTSTTDADTRAVESSSEDEADFNPDDESTPLKNRRSTMPRRASEEQQGEESQVLPELGSSKKRKSAGGPEGSARSAKVSRMEQSEPEAPEVVESDSESELSELPSPQALPPRPSTPVRENDEESAAPPVSSDSEDGAWPDIHDLGRRRRRLSVHTPPRGGDDNGSNISSPPSLTHSPNLAPAKAPKTRVRQAKRQPSPKLTTADLANLIPQRRSKRRDGFDLDDGELDTADLGQHDDELSYLDATRQRNANRSNSRPSRKAKTAAKGKQVAASGKRQLRGYSRRSLSDKENQSDAEEDQDEEDASRFVPLPDETFDEALSAANGQAEELVNATKKFKEVDRWELSFEEAIGDSSPIDAR